MSFGELARRAVRRLRGNASFRAARREARGAIRQIRDLKASHPGRTVCGILLVEHHTDFVFRICNRVTALDLGRLVRHGTPEEVRNDPEVIRVYLGG